MKPKLVFTLLCSLIMFSLTIIISVNWQHVYLKNQRIQSPIESVWNVGKNQIHKSNLPLTDFRSMNDNHTLETTIQCVGSIYNQSCLYFNLYYVDSTFMILIVKGRKLPPFSVQTDSFDLWPTIPSKRIFDTYSDLENFVRTIIDPKIIPSVTVHFGQYWHYNVGHALFDGLYPAYVALIRFAPRHLYPFRILARLADCNNCWAEDIYRRFSGFAILKQQVLNSMSKGRWFMFEELIMGTGALCQRCTQPNLQLPASIELDASRLFRDRIYRQHGLIQPAIRHRSSSERRKSNDLLLAYIIHNKRFTSNDRKEIIQAINEINQYTNAHFNKTNHSTSVQSSWPFVRVSYLFYDQVRAENGTIKHLNITSTDFHSSIYEFIDSNFNAQLKMLRQMDIHITGPGTGQMYQTFLPDGSVTINLGSVKPWGSDNTEGAIPSYLEQYMTSGTPYIKGLYYPINERTKGIKKDQVVRLIREATQLILQGFSLPVNPYENLALDGQLFVEMCEKDKEFCSLVTVRTPNKDHACLNIWVEDFVHEYRQWQSGGFIDNGRNISCPYNHSLLHELRKKYGIKH